jgi:hypothetical protein
MGDEDETEIDDRTGRGKVLRALSDRAWSFLYNK